MRILIRGFHQTCALTVVASLVVGGVGQVAGQEKYSAVTDATLLQLKLIQYFTPDKKLHDADFDWRFTKSEFIVKKGKGPIPSDLLEKLLPAGSTADEIRGKWELKDEGGQSLVLTEIRSGDNDGRKDVTLKIYRTPPNQVRISEPQYVFVTGK